MKYNLLNLRITFLPAVTKIRTSRQFKNLEQGNRKYAIRRQFFECLSKVSFYCIHYGKFYNSLKTKPKVMNRERRQRNECR